MAPGLDRRLSGVGDPAKSASIRLQAAAMRVYRGIPEPGDDSLIAGGMAAFCAEVRSLAEDSAPI